MQCDVGEYALLYLEDDLFNYIIHLGLRVDYDYILFNCEFYATWK